MMFWVYLTFTWLIDLTLANELIAKEDNKWRHDCDKDLPLRTYSNETKEARCVGQSLRGET